MTIKQVPVLELPKALHIHDDMIVQCSTANGLPRIYVMHAGTYIPDLHRWAQQRESVRQRCEAAGIRGLSELGEVKDKTMRTIAWDDMQQYINGGE